MNNALPRTYLAFIFLSSERYTTRSSLSLIESSKAVARPRSSITRASKSKPVSNAPHLPGGFCPVLRGKLLAGIITDTDIFHIFLDALGARHSALRINLNILDRPGQIARLTQAIAEKGGNLTALVTFQTEDNSRRLVTIKVSGINREEAKGIIGKFDDMVLEDIRESQA